MELPQAYISNKFHSYSTFIRETSSYLNGSCPICHEGDSWGKKRRLFYFLHDDYLYCHKCGRSWTPYFWIKEVSGMSFKEIKEELKDYDYDFKYKLIIDKIEEKQFELPLLPGECVNLKDDLQIKYFSNYPVVDIALNVCKQRRLFTAINSPKTYYVCLNDKFHGNRLIIPFYNSLGKVEYYISRKLLESDTKAKYLIKFGSDKPVFNIDKIDENFPYIFIFEGQIDSMFVKNGVAISGVKLTEKQDEELTRRFPFHQIVWILDNYRLEKDEVQKIIKDKLQNNNSVFLYENEFSKFKDLNEYCIEREQDQIDPALILKHSYRGDAGLIRL
jgi:hypothetical protein